MAFRGAPTLLTNANGGKSSRTTSKEVWCGSKMSSTFLSKDGGIAKNVVAKVHGSAWLVQGPQKWDHQYVDKYNVCFPTPCLENVLTKVHSWICTVGGKLVAIPPLHEPNEVQKTLDLGSTNLGSILAREWPWQGHPTITRSTWPNLHKFSLLISVISQGRCAKHPQMTAGSNYYGYNTIIWWIW